MSRRQIADNLENRSHKLPACRSASRAACRYVVVASFVVSALFATPARVDAEKTSVAIEAGKVYIGDGQRVDNATILIENGRIAEIGSDIRLPEGLEVIKVRGASITPGLIDANSRIESAALVPVRRARANEPDGFEGPETSQPDPTADDTHSADATDSREPGETTTTEFAIDRGASHVGDTHEEEDAYAVGVRTFEVINEQSSEVVPHIRVVDSLNLGSSDLERLVRGGVTTVYVSPDASAVIGARGAVLHTGGPEDQRVLVPEAAVKATVGSDPSRLGTYNRSPSRYSLSMYARRPNSRMGLTWVFRKAFYDALRRRDGVPAYGADTSGPEASTVLLDVLDGKVPLRIQARIQQDILTALRLAEEFDLRFTLEEATEAYLCLDELKARSVPVIFGPIYDQPSGIRAYSREGTRSRYFTFRALLEAGIPTALSAQEFREEDGLARQAMYAMRFGVGLDEALRAVTHTPAQMLGLDKQLGTLESGKRADLVVWSGRPFAATSRILLVLIDGEVVVDRR